MDVQNCTEQPKLEQGMGESGWRQGRKAVETVPHGARETCEWL